MSTLGYLLVLGALFLVREVLKGRVSNITGDLSDASLALIQGDTAALSEVLSRTGTDNTADQGTIDLGTGTLTNAGKGNPANGAPAGTPVNNVSLLRIAVQLGQAAKGYKLGAVGPDYYDCSGLVYTALKQIGYKGSRFVTGDVLSNKWFTRIDASNVQYGDIVVWPAHHMGIVSGTDQFYSARSVKSGIGQSPISTFGSNNHWANPTPTYIRFTKGI